MKRLLTLCLAVLLVSCGYHLGGIKKTAMKDLDTFCVDMFQNNTTYQNVSMQITTALADQLQRDGTYRMVSRDECDFVVSGVVTSVSATSLRTNPEDTYLSSEIGLTVHVRYTVRNTNTGKEIVSGSVSAEGSYFNETGSVQTARDSALSYATRRAAELIVQHLTIP